VRHIYFIVAFAAFSRTVVAQVLPNTELLLQFNHKVKVTAAAFSPGKGRYAATGDENGKVKIWVAQRRLVVNELVLEGEIKALAFTPSEDTLIVETNVNRDRRLTLIDWASGRTLAQSPTSYWKWLTSDFPTGMHYFWTDGTGLSILRTDEQFQPIDTILLPGVERFYCRAVARPHTGLKVGFGYESGLVEIIDLKTMIAQPMPSDTFGFREYIDMNDGFKRKKMRTPDAMAVQSLHFSMSDTCLIATFGRSDPEGNDLFNLSSSKSGKIVVWSIHLPKKIIFQSFPFKHELNDAVLIERTGEIIANGREEADDEEFQFRSFAFTPPYQERWMESISAYNHFCISPDEKLMIAYSGFFSGLNWFEVDRHRFPAVQATTNISFTTRPPFFHPTAPRLCFEMPDFGWDLSTWQRTHDFKPFYYSDGYAYLEKPVIQGSFVGQIYSSFEPEIQNSAANLISGINNDTFSQRFRIVMFQEQRSGLRPLDTLFIHHRLSNKGAGLPALSPALGYVTVVRSQKEVEVFNISRHAQEIGQKFRLESLGRISTTEKWRHVRTFFSANDSLLLSVIDDQYDPDNSWKINMGSVEQAMILPRVRLIAYNPLSLQEQWSIDILKGAEDRLQATSGHLFYFYDASAGDKSEESKSASIIEVRDLGSNGRLIHSFQTSFKAYEIFPAPVGNVVAVVSENRKEVALYDWSNGKHLKKLITKAGEIETIDFRIQDSLLLLTGNGIAEIWNYQRGDLLATLAPLPGGEIIFTPQGHYMAPSPKAARQLTFRRGKEVWPVQEYDLLLNRPDQVISSLGLASSTLIQQYRAAWIKRIEKYGLSPEQQVETLVKKPNITIVNSDEVPYDVADPRLSLEMDVAAGDLPVAALQVWINRIPLFPETGLPCPVNKEETIRIPLDLELSPLKNIIEAQGWDIKGQRSAVVALEVNYDTLYLPDLYAVFMGVSNYRQHPPLAGPSSDVRLLASIFTDPGHNPASLPKDANIRRMLFKQVFLDTLIDETVSLERLASLRAFFSKAKPGDYAIIYYAGHGLLINRSEYYLSTWATDFNHPETNSILYDTLLEALSSSPARQRLLMVNACNSGEYDAEMQQFQRMRSLFPDFRNNNGTHVIAAAASNEAAFAASQKTECLTVFGWSMADFLLNFSPEDDQINPRDLDFDGRYTVSECAAYLSRSISKLTNGYQKPELRQFNPDADFRIWKRWIRLSREVLPCNP